MHICTCSRCGSKTCTDPGGSQHRGQFVTRQTQLKHHLLDAQPSLLDSSRHEGSPEPEDALDGQVSKEDQWIKSDEAFKELQLDGCDPSLTGK